MSYNRRSFLAGVLGATTLGSRVGFGQAFPSRPIRWIVGYQAGGGLDLVARVVGEAMSKPLGQSIIVDNRPGAAGAIAASAVATSAADGYTLISLDLGTYALNPALYSKLSYSPDRDFAMVGMMVTIPMVLFINARIAANTVAEFASYVRSQPPGSVNYASSGVGNPLHLSMELFQDQAKIMMTHVPYRGAPPALTDLMNGQVQAMFNDPGSSMPHVRSGALKALAVATAKRLPAYPELPTLLESGFDVQVPVWVGLGLRSGTPSDAIAKLSEALAIALQSADVVKRMNDVGFVVTPSSSAEAEAFVKKQLVEWSTFIKQKGVKLD